MDVRRKGADFERQVCLDLNLAGYRAKRNLDQYQETSGRDITIDAPVCIQCKVGKRPNWRAALEEATASAELGEYAVAVTKDDRGVVAAHIPWADFVELLALSDVRHAMRPRLDPPV